MKRPPSEKLKWTPEAIAVEAKRYQSRKAFFDGSKGAYCAAYERGLLNEGCGLFTRLAAQMGTDEASIRRSLRFCRD